MTGSSKITYTILFLSTFFLGQGMVMYISSPRSVHDATYDDIYDIQSFVVRGELATIEHARGLLVIAPFRPGTLPLLIYFDENTKIEKEIFFLRDGLVYFQAENIQGSLQELNEGTEVQISYIKEDYKFKARVISYPRHGFKNQTNPT